MCDEPVSALDVSVQAQILNLMQDLQDRLKLTYLFVTHDMSVVRHISDDIVVMYLGQMVEKAPADALFEKQLHPYTKALISAIPSPTPSDAAQAEIVKGELSSPIEPKPRLPLRDALPLRRKRVLGRRPRAARTGSRAVSWPAEERKNCRQVERSMKGIGRGRARMDADKRE